MLYLFASGTSNVNKSIAVIHRAPSNDFCVLTQSAPGGILQAVLQPTR